MENRFWGCHGLTASVIDGPGPGGRYLKSMASEAVPVGSSGILMASLGVACVAGAAADQHIYLSLVLRCKSGQVQ